MKVKLIYGAPCSGKSTYVKEHAGEHDLIWDFDKLLAACTNRTGQSSEQHPMANFVIDLRKMIIEATKSRPSVETLYITTLWVSDKLLGEVEGLDFEKFFVEATKEECFQHLAEDSSRSDKGGWKKLINSWFNQHGSEGDKPQSRAGLKNFWRFVRNEAGERILRLEGLIGSNTWADDEINPNKFRAELNADEGDLIVWLNSEGGDFWAGVQIYNMLKEYSGKVTIKIDAIAASAASVIAMAGDSVEISASGMMMIHNPWTCTQGDAAQMKSVASMLDEVKESIITAYELKTHLLREEISRLMDEETYFNAHRAVELGFADKVIGEKISTRAATNSTEQVINYLAQAISQSISAAREIKDDNHVDSEKVCGSKKRKANSFRRRVRVVSGIGGIEHGDSGTL